MVAEETPDTRIVIPLLSIEFVAVLDAELHLHCIESSHPYANADELKAIPAAPRSHR